MYFQDFRQETCYTLPMNGFERKTAEADISFLIAFGIYLFLAVLQTTFFKKYLPEGNLMNGILLVLLLLLSVREYRFGTFDRAAVLLLAAAVLFAGNALISSTLWLAFPFLLMFSGRQASPRKLFLFAGLCSLAVLAFVVISARAGIITDFRRIEVNRTNNRSYLGFLYALYPGALLFNGCALIVAVRGKNIRFLTLAALIAADIWVYRATDGRMTFLLTAVLLAAALLARLFPSLFRNIRGILVVAVPFFPACACFSVIVTYRFNSAVRWMNRLDLKLNHRLKYGRQSIDKFGVGLFGHKVRWIGYGLNADGFAQTGDYLYVDNMYVNFLQRFGWIAFAAGVILVTYALYRMYRARRYELLFIFILLTVHGLLDDLTLQLSYNTFWIAAAHAIAAGGRYKEAWDYESIC